MFFSKKSSPSSHNPAPSNNNGTSPAVQVQPPLRGLNRANDQVFQELKATYLSEFDFKGIQMTATPLHSSVLRGLQTELPILFEIKVGQRSNVDKEQDFGRTPFNVCLVLDNSGSMDGARLQGCKKAINTIIQQLTPHDTLSLVTYSSTVKTVFVDCNHKHKNFMLASVDQIKVEGMTNLHDGLKVGVESLKQSIMKEESAQEQQQQQQAQHDSKRPQKKAHRVFLFSDGLVNQGITLPATIMAHVKDWLHGTDISVSTFGIGEGYDEKLMTAIAQHANGDSFFIETEDDIEDLVSKGLRGVSNMIAPAAILKIRGLGDAVIKDIPGYDMTKTPGQITIRNLRINGLIQLVVNLDIRVPGQNDFSEDDMVDVEDLRKVLGYSLTFEGDQHFVNMSDCKGLSDTVSVNYTTDSSLVSDDKKNEDVVAYLAIKEAAKIDEEVVEHLANNRTAEALSAKKRVVHMYSAAASKDRWGFAKVMQNQSERLVRNLETSGNTQFAQVMSAQQKHQASDNDMGFGLFD
ncbi:hypothetical protein BGZ99_000438 [Dissophora globulifera]|uniref:VWFA domain-containing protein n=1 Tax=Dissophora globulifera TaxID=979702 RepID=A0A9P6R257_9FUNG|nr:hypothetical protein BGZ99_000438 [Dissophora globulifera]